MKIHIKRRNDAFHFEARNESGQLLQMDANPEIGGENMGFRPMETLLAGLAGCSGIDIVLILKKQNQHLEDFQIEVEANRIKKEQATIFENIHLHFHLYGSLEFDKVARAIQLSLEKYCSVAFILQESAHIHSTFTIHPSIHV